jgi:hypothetical protein
VSDNDDRVVFFSSSISSSILAVEIGSTRARLVEQDHLGLHRDRAGDAQPLLLAAGQAQAIGVELVLDLSAARRGAIDALVELAARKLLVGLTPKAMFS